MAVNPCRVDAAVLAQWNGHEVATVYDVQAAVFGGHFVDSRENGQVFDVFDVRVGVGVDVGGETAYSGLNE